MQKETEKNDKNTVKRLVKKYGIFTAVAVLAVGGFIYFQYYNLILRDSIIDDSELRYYSDGSMVTVPPTSIPTNGVVVTYTPLPIEEVKATVSPTNNPASIRISESGEEYVLIENLPIIKEFTNAKLHLSEWNIKGSRQFRSADKEYESGLGMYIPFKASDDRWAQDKITFDLDGKYEKIQFDIFADSQGKYDAPAYFGLYDVLIRVDGRCVFLCYDMYHKDIVDNEIIILPERAKKLTIEFSQTKGKNGALDVVIGDFFLYPFDEESGEEWSTPSPLLATFPPYSEINPRINVRYLEIWSEPDLSSEVVGEIPYGYYIPGSIWGDSQWMLVSFDGVLGYICLGEMDSGRAGVVYSEEDLEPLE